MPGMTSLTIHGACISSTSSYTSEDRQTRAKQDKHKIRNYDPSVSILTYLFINLSLYLSKLGYRNGVIEITPMQVCEDLQSFCILIRVDKPPVSTMWIGTRRGYLRIDLGLSGKASEPIANTNPRPHWIKRGIRHEKSDSMKEQKYPVH